MGKPKPKKCKILNLVPLIKQRRDEERKKMFRRLREMNN